MTIDELLQRLSELLEAHGSDEEPHIAEIVFRDGPPVPEDSIAVSCQDTDFALTASVLSE